MSNQLKGAADQLSLALIKALGLPANVKRLAVTLESGKPAEVSCEFYPERVDVAPFDGDAGCKGIGYEFLDYIRITESLALKQIEEETQHSVNRIADAIIANLSEQLKAGFPSAHREVNA